MRYTVKKLSELSGVTVRTLHWYDEVGLLKPAYFGNNGYRYYEEEQLLRLQQILFFRELGFPLKDIRGVLGSSDFNKIKALSAHRRTLKERLIRTNDLIETIDKTILHLRGEQKMKEQEFYSGFSAEKQKEYEAYLIERHGDQAGELIAEGKKRTKNWKHDEWKDLGDDWDRIHKSLVLLIEQGEGPTSPKTQEAMKEHLEMVQRFYEPTKEVYVSLGDLYCENPDFRKYYDAYHPNLAEFLAKAMKAFAKENL